MNIHPNNLAFNPNSIPDGVAGENFSQDITIGDGLNRLTNAFIIGDSDGLVLVVKNADAGIVNISGTLRESGTFNCQLIGIYADGRGGVLNF